MSNSTEPGTAYMAGVGLILLIAFIVAMTVNILVLFVFYRVTQLRKPSNFLLVNMSVSDLLACVLWLLFAVVGTVSWDWPLGDGFCHFHYVIGTWTYIVCLHTFVSVAFEKFILIWKPSKHHVIFYNKTTMIILICGIWVFDLVMAMFPVMGWSKVAYSPYQFQCASDYKESLSHISFLFAMTFALSFICCAVFFGLAFYRVHKAKTRVAPGEALILEEDSNIPRESYAVKLHRVENKIKRMNYLDSIGNEMGGTASDSDAGYKSEDDWNDDKVVYDYVMKKQKRSYQFKENDFKLIITTCIAWLVYSLCWLPAMIMGYFMGYHFQNPPPNGAVAFSAVFGFFSLFVKPLIYVTNKQLRAALVESFKKKETEEERRMRKIKENKKIYKKELKKRKKGGKSGSSSSLSSSSSSSDSEKENEKDRDRKSKTNKGAKKSKPLDGDIGQAQHPDGLDF